MRYISRIVCILFIFIIAACQSGPLPQEKIYNHFEQAVKLESGFENQQDIMISLETKEKELYDQIVSLGLKEIDKIEKLSKEALVIVEERKTGLDIEYSSMMQSKQEFEKAIDIIADMNEVELKENAESTIQLMNTRYSTYEELYKAYGESIELDKQLYTLFQDKDLTIEQLEEQIQMVNSSYEKVLILNEKFNEITEKYNNQKKTFYVNAGLDLSIE